MTARRRPLVLAVAGAVAALMLSACGDDGENRSAAEVQPAGTTAAATPAASAAATAPAAPDGPATAPCERVTPSELSAAFGATFAKGVEVTDGQCVFDSDGAPQFRLTVYPGASTLCEMMAGEFEQVEIAGSPGFWDEAGAQARACLPDESVSAILNGGGGDNAVHRQALIDLVTLAAGR